MLCEIGSNFWEFSIGKNNSLSNFFWGNSKYYKQYFKSGRNAIKALCNNIHTESKKVFLPIYTCETVIQPFLDEGWDIVFYRINKDLTISEQEFVYQIKKEHPSVVVVHSYFGFNTNANEQLFQDCKKNGVIIVEDMTQSLFSDHRISCADYYVASFRKFLAIPDGGVLISSKPLEKLRCNKSNPNIVQTALAAFELKADYMSVPDRKLKDIFREKYMELNRLIADNSILSEISPLSIDILNSCDVENIRTTRRANYHKLYTALYRIKKISIILGDITDTCVPLYFPIYVENRKKIQSFLAEQYIYCPVIWPKPIQIFTSDDNSKYMYEHMLCIPIDQRYGADDMNKIICAINEFYS